jgi:dihydroneopterin aldolase
MSDSDALLLGVTGDGLELIRLQGIAAKGYHGVYPDERRDGQMFMVDITAQLERDSRADDVATTVDYGALASEVADDITGEPVDLIESLAGRIAATCLRHGPIRAVVVTVHKPQAPMPVAVSDAAVTVVRSR